MLFGSFVEDFFFLVLAAFVFTTLDRVINVMSRIVTACLPAMPDAEPSESEEEEEDVNNMAWKRVALNLAKDVVNNPEPAGAAHSMDQLFEVMVSMGVLQFATDGYTFKLTRQVIVTKIVK